APPPPPAEAEVLPPPQPIAVAAATEINAASRAPQRRRRGAKNRSTQARVAPEPAANHGVLPDGCSKGVREGLVSPAVVVEALRTNEGGTPVLEVIFT